MIGVAQAVPQGGLDARHPGSSPGRCGRPARTVRWVVDDGSSHAGKTSVKRMSAAYPNAELIRLPVHASWLNQIEIYFSIVQRKALTPTTSRRSPNWPGT
jgi:hypothetical protein